jgi:RNA polymerase sigma factor (sigma-70 family)
MSDTPDCDLIERALRGDRAGVDALVRRHQDWIYNLAIRMTGSREDAEDATQEVLIKAVTRLSTFRGASSFRTWLYRIASNHLLTMAMRRREHRQDPFGRYGKVIDTAPVMEWPDEKSLPVDRRLLLEETKLGCMMGTLRCLDRRQRLVFILGGIFEVDSRIGAEVMEIGADNFRQILSRSRRRIARFMEDHCGLMDERNTCRCEKKTMAGLAAEYIDARNLQYTGDSRGTVQDAIGRHIVELKDLVERKAQEIFRRHPFWEAPDFKGVLDHLQPR